jgi:hypothetical protein
MEPDEKTVHNERIKYTATFLNTIAVGCVALGALTPIAAMMEGVARGTDPRLTLVRVGGWIIAGGVLHLCVRWLLGRLR